MNTTFPIYYETLGDTKNPCIILIPGIGGQLSDWPSTLIEGLEKNGYFVVTLDNRDSGLSRHYEELGDPNFNEAATAKQRGKEFKLPYTLEDMAADVVGVMDKLKVSKAHILGTSMGGIIAQYIAINFPNRVLSLICIYSTSGDLQLPPAKKEVLDFFSQSTSTQDLSEDAIINNKLELYKIYNHPDYFDEKTVTQKLTKSFRRAHYPQGFKRTLLAMISAEPRTKKLKKLSVPTLIIHGDYDPVFTIEHGKQLAESIPGSKLEIVKKMGHGLPDFFSKKVLDLIIKFLQ